MFNVLSELGYYGVNVALKSDAAPELRELKKVVAAKRSSPTVPLEVPIRESKAHGAVARADRTWQGQFRTLKSHLSQRLILCCLVNTQYFNGVLGGLRRFLIWVLLSRMAAQCLNMLQGTG